MEIASSTVESIDIPKSTQPGGPVISINLPSGDHTSYQKEDKVPLRTKILTKGAACSLYFNIFFQVHEPNEDDALIDQKEPFQNK